MKTIISITGYGTSGKSAIADYLRQFDCSFSFPTQIEFELFRVPGGLMDLYTSIFYPYNLIRIQNRISEFKKLIQRIGRIQTIRDPISYWKASGHNYEKLFKNQFFYLSDIYMKRLIKKQIHAFWPYEYLYANPHFIFLSKLKRKIFKSLVTKEIYYTDKNDFLKATSEYIHSLFETITTTEQTHILLNNAFEPYNPAPYMDMAGNAFSIIVDRDPRDIYANIVSYENAYITNAEKHKTSLKERKLITNVDSIEEFIFRHRNIKKNIAAEVIGKFDQRILQVRYEDFILNHDATAKKISEFINIPSGAKIIHKYFELEKSMTNVGLWKKYSHSENIKLIEKELSEYCYQ